MTFTYDEGRYHDLWMAMVPNPDRKAEFAATAARLYKGIAIYREIERRTGVPAAVVMVIHERECDGDFRDFLGNGQPLNMVTTEVPKGEGPFPDFISGAIRALKIDRFDQVTGWCVEVALYHEEAYNGPGYFYHGVPSPYVWGGTNQQKPGKYVRDGVWDPTVMDVQEGCAPLMSALFALDPSLRIPFDRELEEEPAPVPVPRQRPDLPPVPPTPPAPPAPPAPGPVPDPVAPMNPLGALINLILRVLAMVFGAKK